MNPLYEIIEMMIISVETREARNFRANWFTPVFTKVFFRVDETDGYGKVTKHGEPRFQFFDTYAVVDDYGNMIAIDEKSKIFAWIRSGIESF